jgi:hypothetical protein
MGRLQYDIKRDNNSLKVTLTGVMDEEADLAKVFSSLDGATIFDLGGIDRINSMGIHRWIPLITDLADRHPVTIQRISYPMVLQANTVANLFGKAKLESCLAPYFSPAVRENFMVEVRANEVVDGAAPTKPCPKTGQPMEFDELDSYFYFLQRFA